MTQTSTIYGVLAEYDTASGIYHACEKVRDAGYKKWDACTPFPVHGLDKAMGLPPSKLPWFVLLAGISGATLAILFMVWVSAFDYPLNIGGKPTWSIPAFIPVMFEVTILFSALTTVFGMFYMNRLPTFNHPLFKSVRFEKVTDDKFFIVIESSDPHFNREATAKLLVDSGAVNTEVVEA
ncbi:MAG: DUF3341 domain-containing protein [bacterium]|nr:DUF3341 domain-containing protein [bacterium]